MHHVLWLLAGLVLGLALAVLVPSVGSAVASLAAWVKSKTARKTTT